MSTFLWFILITEPNSHHSPSTISSPSYYQHHITKVSQNSRLCQHYNTSLQHINSFIITKFQVTIRPSIVKKEVCGFHSTSLVISRLHWGHLPCAQSAGRPHWRLSPVRYPWPCTTCGWLLRLQIPRPDSPSWSLLGGWPSADKM